MPLFSPLLESSDILMKRTSKWPFWDFQTIEIKDITACYCPLFSDDVCIGKGRVRPIQGFCMD